MANTQAKSKILPLTSVRFFVALYVLLFHAIPGIPSHRHDHGVLARIIGVGYVCVPFFFLLSGFILAIVYLNNSASVDKRKFYLARFARIYPLYLVAMSLDLPHFLYTQRYITHQSWGHSIAVILAAGGLVQAWFASLQGFNQPGWSLSVEAFFYLLFPFIGGIVWRMRERVLLPFAVCVYAGGTLLVWIISHTTMGRQQQACSPLEHLYAFVLGICLAKLFVWISADSARSQTLQRCAPWLLLGSLAAFFAVPVFDLSVPEMLMQHGVQVPLFALILLAFASGNVVISTLFSASWLVVLGEASFALYLIHAPLNTIMRRPIERYGMPAFLIYVVVTIGLSVASIYWLENPARRWILEKERARSLKTEATSVMA
jgi:peptidoglycan/LPS O-acetylase OafA/YrhL